MVTGTAAEERPIGRDRETAEVEARLRPGQIVTITGLGGTGKSTLAREVARGIQALGQRVFEVDLAPIDDAAAVPSSIAVALGLGRSATETLRAAIGAALERSATLLVLDNLEQVLEARDFIADLSLAAPNTRILTTSRMALRVAAEIEYRLDPLPSPSSAHDVASAPASVLFLTRSAIEPEGLEMADREAVVNVCRALDGLPLAIELAAGWSRMLSPRAIERRLADARLLVEDASRNRQSSVEAIVDATLELLEPDDELAFRRLGPLVGWFDEAAARSTVGRDDVLERLRRLSSAALVQVMTTDDGEPAFRILETVRSVAVRRLAIAGEDASIRRCHAEHYAAIGDAAAVELRHRTFGNPIASARLNDPNLVVGYEFARKAGLGDLALRLATDLGAAAIRSGNLSQAIERLQVAKRQAGEIPAWLEADALNSLVSMQNARGAVDQRRLAETAVAAARRADDPTRVARTLVTLANEISNVDPASAIPVYREAIEAAEAAGYGWVVAIGQMNLGNNNDAAGDPVAAAAAFAAAKDAFERIGDPVGAAVANSALGDVRLAAGDTVAATAAYEASVGALRGTTCPPQQVTPSLCGLAVLAARAGDEDEALVQLGDMLKVLGDSESAAAWLDVAIAAIVALAGVHPLVAARVSGTVKTTDAIPAFRDDVILAVGRLESLLGSSGFARAQRAGRRAERAALRAELGKAVASSGAERAVRLRAAYERFTPREAAVMARLAAGRRDPEIAIDLGMSPKTASVHVMNIKAKLGVANRVEAALIAQRLLGDARRASGR